MPLRVRLGDFGQHILLPGLQHPVQLAGEVRLFLSEIAPKPSQMTYAQMMMANRMESFLVKYANPRVTDITNRRKDLRLRVKASAASTAPNRQTVSSPVSMPTNDQ